MAYSYVINGIIHQLSVANRLSTMFTALWPSAPPAAVWHADKLTGGPRIG